MIYLCFYMNAHEYDIIMVLDPKHRQTTRTTILKLLQSKEIQVIKEENWGRKDLPHYMKKEPVGIYNVLKCKIKPDAIQELKDEIGITSNLLHHMIFRTPNPTSTVRKQKNTDNKYIREERYGK